MSDEVAASDAEDGTAVTRIARPPSLAAIVVDQIRELIVTGGLALGEQLSENALASRLGVSRTPVREAFLRLEAERLVEVRPQRGTFVFQVDAAQARDICELREVLERGALRIGIERNGEALVRALALTVEAAASAAVASAAAYQRFDTEFHQTLVAASENPPLIEAYGLISGRVQALRHRFITTLEQVAGSQREHARVLAQLRAGDAAGAEATLSHHVFNSYRALRQVVARGHADGGADTDEDH